MWRMQSLKNKSLWHSDTIRKDFVFCGMSQLKVAVFKPFMFCPQHSFSCSVPASLLCMFEIPAVLCRFYVHRKEAISFLPLQFHSSSPPLCFCLSNWWKHNKWMQPFRSFVIFQKDYRIQNAKIVQYSKVLDHNLESQEVQIKKNIQSKVVLKKSITLYSW